MNEQNRASSWVLVIVLVVLAILFLWPPQEKLKGGIDLVGGTSLIYEIDTRDLDADQQRDLAARVISILRERVDPDGQKNLEWRALGNDRLEVRMPRPPKRALARRDAFNKARERIAEKNLARFDVESALSGTADERAALGRGVTERAALIEALVSSYQAYRAVQEGDDPAATSKASADYEKDMAKLLRTSFPVNRLADVLESTKGDKREAELARMRTEFPSFDAGTESDADGKLLTKAVAAYDAWAKNKADLEDPSDLKRLLRGAGVLEYRILADRDPNAPTRTLSPSDPRLAQDISKYTDQLARFGPRAQPGDRYIWLPVEDVISFMRLSDIEDFAAQQLLPSQPVMEMYAGGYFVLAHDDPEYRLLKGTGRQSWKLTEAYPDRDPMTGRNTVAFRLDPRGGVFFGELTGNNIGRSLCIVLDDSAMSFANIVSQINERGQITGNFTLEKVQSLVRVLEAGSLPARLKETPLKEVTIGPSLGETNRTKGMQAAIGGMVVVMVFMLLYYGVAAGGMADLALVLNILFVLAIMALLQATFTLPGIAGLILTIGMAVDANVLIFERIREERDRGVILKRALNTGYDKAFSTIVDANVTTLIICVILGFVGSEEVKGFAITLGIGITTSMFTALFVTRLIFNTLMAKGMLKDLSMRRIIGVPTVDWIALRSKFWPISIVAVVGGLGLFVGLSSLRTESMYDIEFLGGTSLQVDLKRGVTLTDEEMRYAVTGEGGSGASAAGWLMAAADHLEKAEPTIGLDPGEFVLGSPDLTGDQIGVLMQAFLAEHMDRGGVRTSAHEAEFAVRSGTLDLQGFKAAVSDAAAYARAAAGRLRSARVQSVQELGSEEDAPLSYELVTIETNRALAQAAVLATLGDRLAVQRALTYSMVTDEDQTREAFFVIENADHFLSDVIGGKSSFDIRRYRGGVAVEVRLDEREEPLSVAELEKRIREVGLQPEFEDFRTWDTAVFPLDASQTRLDGRDGYRHFAVTAKDEALLYDEDDVRWTDSLARPHLAQVEAALGHEKSLSKVIQFAPQIAGQARTSALFAIFLAFGAIVSYLWLRFGTKEYGLAAIVALVHDVGITLGLVGVSQLIANSFAGRALLIDAFRIDLPMIAALLTVIGYSLNDTIVVFDRIRENKGRIESINPNILNNSINQCMSRTILTSTTTFMVVLILYIFGGKGVHGFSFALLIGIVVGTYSSIGVATPLLYRPKLLHGVIVVIVTLATVGMIFQLGADAGIVREILAAVAVLVAAYVLYRVRRGAIQLPVGDMARA